MSLYFGPSVLQFGALDSALRPTAKKFKFDFDTYPFLQYFDKKKSFHAETKITCLNLLFYLAKNVVPTNLYLTVQIQMPLTKI